MYEVFDSAGPALTDPGQYVTKCAYSCTYIARTRRASLIMAESDRAEAIISGDDAPKSKPIIDDTTRCAWAARADANPPDRASWVTLIDDLRTTAELDRLGVIDEPGKTAGLQSAFNALHAVVKFLGKQLTALPNCDLDPLMRLHSAIIDLKRNERIDPMFKATLGNGNPGNGTKFDIAKGTAARAMSLLIEAGEPLGKAQQMVADSLSDRTFGTELNGPTIARWRYRLMEGKDAKGVSDAALFAYSRPLPPEFGITPREQAENLLKDLREDP
jgi:hypothetical protein